MLKMWTSLRAERMLAAAKRPSEISCGSKLFHSSRGMYATCCGGTGRNGTERNGMDRNGTGRINKEWDGTERDEMDWNGTERNEGRSNGVKRERDEMERRERMIGMERER